MGQQEARPVGSEADVTEHDLILDQIQATHALMRQKLGAGGATLQDGLRKRGNRLPRHIRSKLRLLAEAEEFASHPKLRFTLDAPALQKAAGEVQKHLNAIDLADRRKGWWLGMLGGMAFNILLFLILSLVFLRWQGFL